MNSPMLPAFCKERGEYRLRRSAQDELSRSIIINGFLSFDSAQDDKKPILRIKL